MTRRKKHQSLLPTGWELEARSPGAGRPPEADSGVSHLKRVPIAPRFPVLVTLRIRDDLPSLRSAESHDVLRRCFRALREGAGPEKAKTFRVVHYAVIEDHALHMIVEAKDRTTLTRGMQGLSIRIARGLNRLWARKGRVFADRYDDRVLRSAEEVREVLGAHLGLGSGQRKKFTSEAGTDETRPTAEPRVRLLRDVDPGSPRRKR